MAAKYLKHQFSIPHHLVPSFEDTAGVLAHAPADDSPLLLDDDDPIVPGAPVTSHRSHHAERDRSVLTIFFTILYFIMYIRQEQSQGWESDRRKLTSDNFYDYYDYADSSGDYEDYQEYQDSRREPSIRNHYHVTNPQGGFFPEINLGTPRPKYDKRPSSSKRRLPHPNYRRGGPRFVKERTSYTEGSWVRPPGQQTAKRPQALEVTRKKTTSPPTLFKPSVTSRPRVNIKSHVLL